MRRLRSLAQAPRLDGTLDRNVSTKRYLRIPVRVNESEMARLRAKAEARGYKLAVLLREEALADVVTVLKAA